MLIASTKKADPAVAVYPDSDKIGIWPGGADPPFLVRRVCRRYWDGESLECAGPALRRTMVRKVLRCGAYVAVVGRQSAGSSPFPRECPPPI